MPNNERERRMSMLRAAMPYTAGNQRHALQMLLQADTLIHTIRRGAANDLESCDIEANPEEMLLQIQEFCTPRESDMVQTILNFLKANHLFQNYREFMDTYPENHSSADLQAAGYSRNSPANPVSMFLQLFGGSGKPGNSNHFMEFLVTQLPPEQRQLFEQLQALSEAGMFPQAQDNGAQEQEPDDHSGKDSRQERGMEDYYE